MFCEKQGLALSFTSISLYCLVFLYLLKKRYNNTPQEQSVPIGACSKKGNHSIPQCPNSGSYDNM